jgi:putative ABC transport system substrate-binding protein
MEAKSMRETIVGQTLSAMLRALDLLYALLLAVSVPAEAQQSAKVPRVGYLHSESRFSATTRVEAFRQSLRKLGYVEGQNIVIEYHYAEGQLGRLPNFAAELVRLQVDAIVTSGSPPTRAAKEATRTIPIVRTNVGDPIAGGFVASLAKPGGNITGLTQISSDLGGKRLELLKEAFPKVSHVGVFVNTVVTAQRMHESWQQTQLAAQAVGVNLVSLQVWSPNPDFNGAFKTANSERVNGLLIAPGPVLSLHRKRVVGLVAESRLPAIYPQREFVDAGGLMSYGPDYTDLYRRAAVYVDKILKGRRPADLPVERPIKFEFIINLKTAKQIGLTIPPNVLARADRVIR